MAPSAPNAFRKALLPALCGAWWVRLMTSLPPLAPTPDVPDGWQGLLDPGERVLWQGRPVPGLYLRPFEPVRMLVGAIFTAFSVFWMSMVVWIIGAADGVVRLFPLFGVPFLAIGLWNMVGQTLWRSYVRNRTTYSLTTARAILATSLPVFGRRMTSYPITSDTQITFLDTNPGTLWFAETKVPGQHNISRQPIGFVRIADARSVYALMRQMQRDSQ